MENITITWILDFTDKYVVGSDGNVYRKSFTKNSRSYQLRLLKLIKRETKGYWLNYRDKQEWWSLIKLRPHLVKTKHLEILIENKELPF